MLKNLFTFLLLLGLSFQISYAQAIDENRQFFKENFEKKELYITMRDGVKLFTAVYAPKDKTQAYPLLMMRTPYSCAPYGLLRIDKPGTPRREWGLFVGLVVLVLEE